MLVVTCIVHQNINIGNVYERLGRQKKALAYYEESNKYDAEHPAGWYNLGNACDDLGHFNINTVLAKKQ